MFGSEHSDPRAAVEASAKKLDEDYSYARSSKVRNAGEDLKGSARHKRNEWRGLEEAEESGDADRLLTRDNLLKAEPHTLSDHVEKNPGSALAMHMALKAFPPHSRNKRSHEDRGQTRRQYLEAFNHIREKAHEIAENTSDSTEAINKLRGVVSNHIDELRSGGYQNRFNETANNLIGLAKKLMSAGFRSPKTSVANQLRDTQDMSHDELKDVALSVMEGKSLNSALGRAIPDRKKPARFDPTKEYVSHAERKGGPDSGVTNAKQATDYMMNKMKARGIQWGNSVHRRRARTPRRPSGQRDA